MEKLANRANQRKQHGQEEEHEDQKEIEKDIEKQDRQGRLHYMKTKLKESQVKFAFNQLKSDSVAKLVGIMAHFVYWSVFGGFNQLPIDAYHMEKMLKTILEQLKNVEEASVKASVDEFEIQRAKRERDKGE